MPDLKEIVSKVKEEADALAAAEKTDTPVVEKVVEEPKNEVVDDDDVMIGVNPEDIPVMPMEDAGTTPEAKVDLKAMIAKDQGVSAEAIVGIDPDPSLGGKKATSMEEWKEKVREEVKAIGIPADSADIECKAVIDILTRRRKQLLVEEGLDDIELEEAMTKRFNREIESLKTKYTGKGTVTVIEIPETEADKVEFTEEQQRKLDKSSKIHLVKVEKKELNTLNIKKLVKPETKLKYVQAMNTPYISKYSVPLPLTGEFATFRGALMVELLQARSEADELLQSIVTKKASLVYKHFVEGTNYKLKDEKGITQMTYAEFINTFRYHDLDLMVYAVICASSGPLTVSDLKCSKCGASFTKEFNVSTLLDMTKTPQNIQDLFAKIIDNSGQLKVMEALKDEMNEFVRVESPVTNNIYDIGAPSIARAIELLNVIDQEDPTDIYIVAIAFFVHGLFIYDKEDDSYISFEPNEYESIIASLKMLPQSELTMLHDMTTDILYNPAFTMNSKCPECGTDLVNNIPVNDLVFFVAPETPVEMKR